MVVFIKFERYSICDLTFDEFDDLIKCDDCHFLVYNKCSKLSSAEIKCFFADNRNLKYFCEGCDLGLKNILNLKKI